MQTDYSNYSTNLHRMIYMVYGAIQFIGASTCHLLRTEKFSCFISLSIGSYKINKIIKLLIKIISTESYTSDMNPKILLEPRYDLIMF